MDEETPITSDSEAIFDGNQLGSQFVLALKKFILNFVGSITAGVSSLIAGTGISVSGATGNVTVTNVGVTSIVAGTGISVSGSTGAVTVSSPAGTYGVLGSQTLSASASFMSIASLPAASVLNVVVKVVAKGTINPVIQFNSDTGTNYSERISSNFADGGSGDVNRTNITITNQLGDTVQAGCMITIVNLPGTYKQVVILSSYGNTANPAVQAYNVVGVWANNSAQIALIKVADDAGLGGLFDIGSSIYVMGTST